MKYIALLSGGKDSCYNLSHCNAHGHELVAAATLSPQSGKDEIDSYLYQTVGQDAIEFVARALDVPLYRRVIQGDAIEQNVEYGSRSAGSAGVMGDETEDLCALLKDAKTYRACQSVLFSQIINAFASNMCVVVSPLHPLAYLWQRDQAELLSEMIDAGIKSVLIKVAGIGLTVKHLGKTLHEMQDTLTRLNSLYGLHICGEGGEYETFTLDSPLFKHRIVLDETEVVMHSDNDFAPVAYLRIKRASLHPKESSSNTRIETPPLLEDKFIELQTTLKNSVRKAEEQSRSSGAYPNSPPTTASYRILDRPSIHAVGSWLAVGNIHPVPPLDLGIPLDQQVRNCFIQLRGILLSRDLRMEDVTNITLLLPSLAPEIFAAANNAYAEFFGVSPPSRACVGVDLPEGVCVMLECIAHKENPDTKTRKALHVQGLSYWAPANIGPYSQAITVEPYVFISGQIGLLPPSLTLPSPSSLALETALVFQHTDRVIRVANNAGGHVLLSLYWLVDKADVIHVRRACQKFGEEMPMLFLIVASLPRGARVEKQVLVHTGHFTVPDEDDEGTFTEVSRTPEFLSGDIHVEDATMATSTSTTPSVLNWQVSRFDVSGSSPCTVTICARGHPSPEDALKLRNLSSLSAFWERALSARLFHRLDTDFSTSWSSVSHVLFGDSDMPAVTSIPCRFIGTRGSDEQWDWAVAFVSV